MNERNVRQRPWLKRVLYLALGWYFGIWGGVGVAMMQTTHGRLPSNLLGVRLFAGLVVGPLGVVALTLMNPAALAAEIVAVAGGLILARWNVWVGVLVGCLAMGAAAYIVIHSWAGG